METATVEGLDVEQPDSVPLIVHAVIRELPALSGKSEERFEGIV